MVLTVDAQAVILPVDFRQHNLTEYNSNLSNPAFSLDRNDPQSFAVWSRWQWQQIDGDPTTLFVNYTRKLSPNSAAGAAFFQHNTGIYLNTGGALNYAYSFALSPDIQLGIGLNLFGYNQIFSDSRFSIDPQIQLPQIRSTNDFILQMAPGLFLMWDKMGIGLSSENIFDYNFTTKERQSGSEERIYMLSSNYDFMLGADNSAVLRPSIYWKSIPGLDNQIGFNTLYSTDKYWGQAGYNNFYGLAIGAGGRFFKNVSLGALMEFSTDTALEGKDPTFEIMAAYHIGEQSKAVKPQKETEADKLADVEKEAEKKAKELAKMEKDRLKKQQDSIAKAMKEKRRADEKLAKQQPKDSLDRSKKAEALAIAQEQLVQKRLDSIANAREAIAAAQKTAQQRIQDSLNQVRLAQETADRIKAEQERLAQQTKEKVKPEANEKYEEVGTEDGLKPGFYLIANVFGTQKYYEAFMKDLTKKGLQPKSFLRSLNNYNYVYLQRYDTMAEARKARDSKFGGKYADKTWIYRVVGD
tara:strand:- start:3237 stop:4811 length:1575 start_codon:yes stop_codon:yes gene_type:complete